VKHEFILVLDFGSQYNQLITRRVRELGVYSELHDNEISIDEIKKMNPKGIILSGGPNSVYEDVNLLYVALTRAKELLLVGEELLYHANAVSKELNNHFITIPDSKIVLNGSKEYQETLLKMRNNLRR